MPGPDREGANLRGMRFAVVLCLLSLLSVPALADPVQDGCSTTLQAQVECWNRADLPGFMQGYVDGPEMTYTAGGEIIRGSAALLDRYQKRYGADPAGMGRLRFADLEVRTLDPEHALVLGRWFLERDGAPAYDGVFTLVMWKQGERWRILHDHSSARPPRPAK